MRTFKTILSISVIAASALLFAGASTAYNHARTYSVTITNVTKAIQFTPILAATHRSSIRYFELGSPASDGLALLAEGGATDPIAEELGATGKVFDTANSADVLGTPPLLFPGQTVTLQITANKKHSRLSLAAMLLPTNDSFVAVDSLKLPLFGSKTVYAIGYDAGSELNDELCANIPGPTCGGAGPSPAEGGEGFVHVANGIHGNGDLDRGVYDWRNPVAKVVVKRLY